MERNISTAQSEYYNRPDDERYETLTALVQAAQADKEHSKERHYNLRDLRAVVINTHNTEAFTPTPEQTQLRLQSPQGTAKFTHWSFGQLCRTVGAPAAYMRTLPPDLAARNLNYGLQDAAPVGTVANLLVRANGGEPIIRAATSETYGRLWDYNLYAEVNRYFGDGISSNGGTWQTPPAWPGSKPSGQYKGDRDSFVIRVDGGSIVSDPSASQGNGQMYRGLMIRNTEVGNGSVTVECVLYRYICGNHMIWGAILDRTFKRRHVGKKITQDTMRELATLAYKFNQRTASDDERIIKGLIDHEIAHTQAAVIDELRKLGMSKDDAQAAYTAAEQHERISPRSYWGAAQGITRISQDSGHQDERLELDRMAAQMIARGAQLVTV